MLRLLLLRHAEAAPATGGSDLDRRLTPHGRAASVRMGAYLKASGEMPDLALVSPATRTLETFEAVQGGMAHELSVAVVLPLYNASVASLFARFAQTPKTVRTLLVIGHNPGLAEAANALSKKGRSADLARLRTQFPAPCLAVITFDATDWAAACERKGRLDRFITLAVLQKSEGRD